VVGVLSSEHARTAAAQDVHHGAIDRRALVRLQLRLKWTLWKRSYRKNVGKIIGTSIGALYALGGLFMMVMLFLGTTLWAGEGELFPQIIRGLGAATVLLWFLVPVLAFGVDDTLDPRAFALFPRTAKELQPGLFAAAALSLPSILTLLAIGIATAFELLWLIVFGQGAGWIVLGALALIPANLAGLALCILLPRAWFAHSAARASSRKGRELGGILGFLAMFVAIYALSLSMQRIEDLDMAMVREQLPLATEVLAWTPLGALFSVPMDLAEGRVLTALLRALIGATTIVLVWRWWRRSIDRSLTSALTGDASSGQAKVSPLVPRFVPAGPFGAVMGKALRYWRRDTRYLAALGIYPVIIVFFVAMGFMVPEARPMMLGMAVFMCAMTGLSLSNEIGFDGPAGWVNIVAGAPARANLLGRIAAMGVLMVPAVVVITVALPLLYGLPQLIPMTVLGSLGAMISGWGSSMVVGVLLPYPSSPPGTNPMKDKSASSSNAMLSMGIAMITVFVPMLPPLGLGIWGAIAGNLALITGAGVLALAIGVVVLLVSLRIATVRLDARYPDIFQKVRDHL
jgi:ABC-2 type transport system permease protein